MIVKLIRWIIFTAICSLIPLAFAYFDLLFKDRSPGIEKIIRNGELLLITTVICATAIGEILASGATTQPTIVRVLKLTVGGAVFIIALFSALLFADVVVTRLASGILSDQYIYSKRQHGCTVRQ